jgi:hypothetical protein
LAGATSYRRIRLFIGVHRERLNATFGVRFRRAPAVNTLRALVHALDPAEIEAAFRRHAEHLGDATAPAGRRVIALDGKTLRSSFDHLDDQAAAQVLSTFASEAALILASEPDHDLEGPPLGQSCRGVRFGAEGGTNGAGRGREDAPRQDRRADAGQRFFRRRARQGRPAEHHAMIDRQHDLSITKQAEALRISRSNVYYVPRPVPAAELAVMRRMDELHLEFPFAGSRMLRNLLNQDGIGRQRVATLMKRMGIEAIYRKPNTSKPAPGHKIYPYLLRGMVIDWFSPSGSVLAVVNHYGDGVSTSRRWRKPLPAMAGRRSSTPTRARRSPATTLPRC